MKNYSCPKCGRDVPLDKINVAKDIMLCPSCGETSSLDYIEAVLKREAGRV